MIHSYRVPFHNKNLHVIPNRYRRSVIRHKATRHSIVSTSANFPRSPGRFSRLLNASTKKPNRSSYILIRLSIIVTRRPFRRSLHQLSYIPITSRSLSTLTTSLHFRLIHDTLHSSLTNIRRHSHINGLINLLRMLHNRRRDNTLTRRFSGRIPRTRTTTQVRPNNQLIRRRRI